MNPVQREACIRAFQRIPADGLRSLLPPHLAALENETEGLAAMLVDLCGADALRDRTIRHALLSVASDDQLQELMTYGSVSEPRGRDQVEEDMASRPWHSGRRWASHFVKVLGLPEMLKGLPEEGPPPIFEVVTPAYALEPLHPYQEQLKQRIMDTLGSPSPLNRGIVSLPTGAGKTRTMVEALLCAMADGPLAGATVLWIAQTEELCEQALDAFRQVWLDFGIRSQGRRRYPPLRLYRVWAEKRVPEPPDNAILVAGIDKLRHLTDQREPQVQAFFDAIDAVVIDEAHRAMAPEYTRVLGLLKLRALDKNHRPLVGLTATPFRTDRDETRRLVRRFGNQVLTPGWADPVGQLRRLEILSDIIHEAIRTPNLIRLTSNEEKQAKEFRILPPSAAMRVGQDRSRNRLILDRLMQIEPGRPTLVFACSVEHAQMLAVLLRRERRTSAALSAETPRSLRRAWIESFRQGDIQFLCNYDILTTGFDAPKVEVVVVARPTASALVYEQMIGRGMRGPRNGGTPSCTIIDFVDACAAFGQPMSYARYAADWVTGPGSGAPGPGPDGVVQDSVPS